MNVVEHYIQSKSGNLEKCEDTFLVNEHFACVIDGATNVSGRIFNERTPGQLAASTIKHAISHLQGHETIEGIIAEINHHYKKLYYSLDMAEEMEQKPYMRPSAAMIIYSKYHHKIWMIGDCQCYFNKELYQNTKHVDEVFSEARSIILKGELFIGKEVSELMENDIGFDLIRPLIQKQYNFQNTDPDCSLSYGVINGFVIPSALIKVIDVPESVEQISLGSDGYPRIFGTLAETEEELARLIKLDPLCINENRGTKGIRKSNVSFDDRTYVKFEI